MRYLNAIDISKTDPLSRFRQWFNDRYKERHYDEEFTERLKEAYGLGIKHALEDMNANALNVVSAIELKGI